MENEYECTRVCVTHLDRVSTLPPVPRCGRGASGWWWPGWFELSASLVSPWADWHTLACWPHQCQSGCGCTGMICTGRLTRKFNTRKLIISTMHQSVQKNFQPSPWIEEKENLHNNNIGQQAYCSKVTCTSLWGLHIGEASVITMADLQCTKLSRLKYWCLLVQNENWMKWSKQERWSCELCPTSRSLLAIANDQVASSPLVQVYYKPSKTST